MAAIRHRRAVRRYTSAPVPDEEVERLLRLALLAPTGHGAQAWGFVVVRDEERRAALADLVLRGAAEYFRLFRPPAEGATPERHAEWAAGYAEEALGSYRDVPVWLCAVVVPRFRHDEPIMERIERFSDITSVSFAIENLLIAARAVGLGTTPTNFHFFVEDEFRALLGLPDRVGLHYLTPLGYPTEFPRGLRPAMARARRPWRTLVHEERFGATWQPGGDAA
ncbi:MAG: nitroreductase family protein [Thermoleophilia bacterium]